MRPSQIGRRRPRHHLCNLRGDHGSHRPIRGRLLPYLVVVEGDGGAHGTDDGGLARRGRIDEPAPRIYSSEY